jgi:hypothetical protein
MRIVLGLAGLTAIGWGAYGWLFGDGSRPVGQAVFLVLALVGHDFVVLPIAVGLGVLVVRYVPAWARVPVQAALVVSAVVAAIALPFILGFGRVADNPSAFPRAYGRNLLIIVALVWTVAALGALINRRRR